MTASAILSITGKMVPVPGNDIDTDRIIPARFLKAITFDGLGEYAFYDERHQGNGGRRDHPFNDPRYTGHSVLVTRKNFGCGSSREHAPQSLMRWGIRALIGESFADIFAGNCAAIGIPAVTAGAESIDRLLTAAEQDPETVVMVDLAHLTITAGTLSYRCAMPESSRKALITGTWDMTSVLPRYVDRIRETARGLPYLNGFVPSSSPRE